MCDFAQVQSKRALSVFFGFSLLAGNNQGRNVSFIGFKAAVQFFLKGVTEQRLTASTIAARLRPKKTVCGHGII